MKTVFLILCILILSPYCYAHEESPVLVEIPVTTPPTTLEKEKKMGLRGSEVWV